MGLALKVMKFPLTMCFAYDGFNQRGSGRGRWYEFRTSSPLEPVAAKDESSIANDGELGSGGILGAVRLEEDWFP